MTSVDLGADHARLRADQAMSLGAAVTDLPRRAVHIVAAPGLPQAAAGIVAAGVAAVAAPATGPLIWLVVAVLVASLVLDLATQTPYERVRGHGSGRRVLVAGGTAVLGMSALAPTTPPLARWCLVDVACTAAVAAGAAGLARALRGPRTVLVVGHRAGVEELIDRWASCRDVDVRGACLSEPAEDSVVGIGDVPVLGSLDDLVDVVAALEVDQVVIAPGSSLAGSDVRRLSWRLESSATELSMVAEVDGVLPRRIVPRVIGRQLTLSVRPGRRARPALWAKGVVDRVGAAALLVLLAPLMVLVSTAIRRGSAGPAIFRQTRVGLGGETFECLKFRTMVVGAEAMLADLASRNEGAGPLFKIAADPRVTRVGALLRRTSLDELPQLVNVLRGEMSLIGPRPALPVELRAYDEWVGRRLRAKPGMTGAWQVGGRSNLSWSESVRLDIDYVDNAGLREDLRIAAKTVRVVLNREGAV